MKLLTIWPLFMQHALLLRVLHILATDLQSITFKSSVVGSTRIKSIARVNTVSCKTLKTYFSTVLHQNDDLKLIPF